MKHYPEKLVFVAITFLLFVPEVFAQDFEPVESYELRRQDINQSAMLVLGSWALGNMLVGSYGHFTTSGQTRYFHQHGFSY